MIIFAAYFDASGEAGYPVLSVGGAVGPVYKWSRFEIAWQEALATEGVAEFHATDFAASQGEYKSWKGNRDRRIRFLRTLGSILKANTNKLFSVSVEMPAWESVNREYLLKECLYAPYSLCGFAIVKQVREWAKRKKVKTPIKFIFEKGDIGWEGLEKLCNGIGVNPVPLPKAEAVPCQAGDLIAWKSRIAFTNGIKNLDRFLASGKPSIEEFLALVEESRSLDKVMVRPGTPGIFSYRALVENCKKFGIPKRPLEGNQQEKRRTT